MVNVYVTRYENMAAFSTARKALESLTDGFWKAYIDAVYDGNAIVDTVYTTVTAENIGKLITLLNYKGFLTLYEVHGHEEMEIQKLTLK